MNCRFSLLLLIPAALAGCATFQPSELAQVRSRGVSPAVVAKLDRGRPVAPADVIELSRRGVPEPWILRQIEDQGVDSIITRSDVVTMRRAGVRPAVTEAMIHASDRFANGYRYPDVSYSGSFYDDPFGYDPYFGGYYPYRGYYGGGLGATFIIPSGHHHRWRH